MCIVYIYIISITKKKLKKEKNYIYFKNNTTYYIFFYENKKIYKFKKAFFKETMIENNVLLFLTSELSNQNIYYFNFLEKKIAIWDIKKILLTNFISKKDYLAEYINDYK